MTATAGHGRAAATAAGIVVLAGVIGALGVASALALVGSTVRVEDPNAATGWTAADATVAAPPEDGAAMALLERAVTAADTVAYAGVTVSRSGSAEPIRLDVAAVPGRGTLVRSGVAGFVVAGEGRSASLADASAVLGRLRANYAVVRVPSRDRQVAGRSAQAVEARRVDGSVAARFWLDSSTGLLLRRDLIGAGGRTTSSTWFADLTMGPVWPAPERATTTDPWPYLLTGEQLAARRAAGCRCASSLPGGLSLVSARVDGPTHEAGPGQGVVHLLYSDGLISVSLFDEPGVLDETATATLVGEGFAPASYAGVPVLERITRVDGSPAPVGEWVWTCGSSIQTLVGPATPGSAARRRVADVVGSLDSTTGADDSSGFAASVRRGWDRVTDAVGNVLTTRDATGS